MWRSASASRPLPLTFALLLVPALVAAGCGTPSESDGGPTAGGEGRGVVDATIPEIQGASHVSPLLDREVRTEGIVTLVGSDGFHLQDPEGDGRAETSDALVVEAGNSDVSPGDRVRVTGRVRERVPGGTETGNLSVTRIADARVDRLGSGFALPDPVVLGSEGRIPPQVRVIDPAELPVDLRDPRGAAAAEFDPESEGIDFYESLEGMRVRVAEPVTVSPTRSFGPGAGELFVLVEEGAHVTPDDARTRAGGILLQPHPGNRGDHNPERVQIQFTEGVTPGELPVVPVGSRLGSVTGVMGYAFGNFEVVATRAVRTSPADPPRETTALAGGPDAVTVASYNVLNLNPLPETSDRMALVGRQIAARLGAPDVVALQEIQDENGTQGGPGQPETDATATLRALVDAVAAAGGPRYEFFDVAPASNSTGGVPGGNIRNAFLYRPDRVERVRARSLDADALEEAGVDEPEAFEGSRPPLEAVFSFRGTPFTVVNNHLTSRFGSTPVFGAIQPFEQAGEEAREAQARALHEHVARRLEEDPGARIVVLGDLNTFEWTDDLAEILPAATTGFPVLHNLQETVPRSERYTFVFDGNSQALDHVFVTGSLREGAELDVVHVNVDHPTGADGSDPASDHEPLVARIPLPAPEGGVARPAR